MNLFEKIFNYQVMSRLDETGAFTITSHERAWLKTMLEHPAASDAFSVETLEKLRALLQPEQSLDLGDRFREKAKSKEKHVYHLLISPIRRIMLEQAGMHMTFRTKDGRLQTEQSGFPYKLEYSMVKREWYLLWYHLRHHTLMSTKLQNIASISPRPLEEQVTAIVLTDIAKIIESRKETAVIEVIPLYNKELSRILYAFSCFEKEVEYSDERETYRIKLTFQLEEREYVLSKLRFLGKRVRILEGEYMRNRMLESTWRALARYGKDES
ncbi:WYL domain-containing protein [Brevibacillus fluminis]|uniref:WYL domain-containing protein n=1 Tax=Brevibacillus fluminis TaxID=511487 RepID=A0A3M8DWD6_9BACL|nr:WYL domain-containing protein [Brevibacillus fluminis]RNB92436.1 WYL domain-containing protein [Brevibacillus fluminis]